MGSSLSPLAPARYRTPVQRVGWVPMRTMLLMLAVLVGGCSPRPCSESCAGCCDSFDECHPGTQDAHCGINGGKVCTICTGGVSCSPSGNCVRAQAGGGAGGGGATGGGSGGSGGGTTAGGGGGTVPPVFVTLRFDYPSDNTNGTCRFQTVATCTVTKSVAVARFQELRTTALSGCVVTQTTADGYDANCTGKCTTWSVGCVQANGVAKPDVRLTCERIENTLDTPCNWFI